MRKDIYYRLDLTRFVCPICVGQILLVTYYSSFTLEHLDFTY